MTPSSEYNQTLLRLARLKSIDDGDLDTCYKEINIAMIEASKVDRASIWFYNEDKTSLTCTSLYEKKSDRFTSGHTFEAKAYPVYFNLLSEQRTLPINDVDRYKSTHLHSNYFLPNQIKSMLNVPIRVDGKMTGVVSCETIGDSRHWTTSDETFITYISELVSRAVQTEKRLITMRAMEKELEDQKIKSMNYSKMATLGEMTLSIAHEINNPLTITFGFLEMLKAMENDPNVTAEERRKVLNDIRDTTLRIDKIVKSLQFFSRDQSLNAFVPTQLGQVLEDTLTLCRQKFYQKGCKIIIDFPKKDLKIKCQPVSISQALLNLLNNAFDAIENNPVKWIKVACIESNGFVTISVTDSGSGIDPELQEKIMVPFFTTKPPGKGTGLGLSIVKGIVEKHNGSFIFNRASSNTSFVMSFPKEAS